MSVEPVECNAQVINKIETNMSESSRMLGTIKSSIPPHCFQSSLKTSLFYVAQDLIIVASLAIAFYLIRLSNLYTESWIISFTTCGVYWFLQGTVFWSIFVLGHDCGHGSFSNSKFINSLVGNILHAIILTPYASWQLSHRHHHKNTGNIDKDEVFYPQRENAYDASVKRAPFLLGFAWFYYLFKGQTPRNRPHFSPWHKAYTEREKTQVSISVSLCMLMLACVIFCFKRFGILVVFTYYLVPLVIFASWLVVTTFLHHQDEHVPWFSGEKWNYVVGNLSSVDRSYWPFDNLIHDIGTHQVHHLFPAIPHYHLVEATRAFRAKFPQLVRQNKDNIIISFYKLSAKYYQHKAISNSQEHWVFT